MSLYSLVNSIVNSQSNEEANELLIGSNILLFNNKEYYNAIISSFIQKKETIIKKENNKLVFDLSNTNDIWNIIFIGEYIKENDLLYKTYNNLLLEISNIEIELSSIKNKHNYATSREEHNTINTEYQKKKNEFYRKKNQIEKMSSVLETFYNTDWINLVNSNNETNLSKKFEILKQAINIIHKVRNSFEHDDLNIDNVISIDSTNFKVSIPIEYLDGFNKGKIIAQDKDKVIVERTNLIVLPLLNELNCDLDSIQNIFYNIDPELLSLILEGYNYNVEKIYNLSSVILENNSKVKELLKNGIKIEIIKKIPFAISIMEVKNIIKMVNYLTDIGLIDKIEEINPWSFTVPEVLRIYIENGIDIDIINSFDGASFYNPIYAYSLIEKINLLKENNIDISKLVKRFSNNRDAYKIPFDYADNIIEFANILKKYNLPIEVIYDEKLLKEELFKNGEKFKKIIKSENVFMPLIRPIYWYMGYFENEEFDSNKYIFERLLKNKINYNDIGVYGQNFEKLKSVLIKNNLYPMTENNNDIYNVLEFLRIMEKLDIDGLFYENVSLFDNINYLINNGINIEQMEHMSIHAIANAKNTLFFIKKNISLDEIKVLPSAAYKYKEDTVELIEFLKQENISLDILNDDLWKYPKNTIKILEVIPKDKLNIIKNLSEACIINITSTIEIINKLMENNIDIENVSSYLIEGRDNSLSLIDFIKEQKYDAKILEKLPAYAFFRFNNIDYYKIFSSEKYSTKKFRTLPKNGENFTQQTQNVIKCLIDNGYTTDKEMPTKIFSVFNVKNENIKYLLELVNYEYAKLDEFSDEFYTCDFEMLEVMCKNYNYNLCKSIFGIGNPKIISTLIYGNSVFSKYQKENHDNLLIDIDPIKIIHSGFNISMKYKNNIGIDDWNQEKYLERFIIDENKNSRTPDQIKQYILDKFRNACAHFRFKPILDENGNLVEDKIYIYDKYNESKDNNFDIVIDIKDFVEITRQVEKDLLEKKYDELSSYEENRFLKM